MSNVAIGFGAEGFKALDEMIGQFVECWTPIGALSA